MMKFISRILVLTASMFANGALAASDSDVEKLKKTNECKICNLTEAELPNEQFRDANLYGTNMTAANLSGADLNGADLSAAGAALVDLSGADLSNALLIGTVLPDSNLSGANLSGADLSNADLSNADLSNADLSGAKLHNVNLQMAMSLDGSNLSSIQTCNTTMPEGSVLNTDCP